MRKVCQKCRDEVNVKHIKSNPPSITDHFNASCSCSMGIGATEKSAIADYNKKSKERL